MFVSGFFELERAVEFYLSEFWQVVAREMWPFNLYLILDSRDLLLLLLFLLLFLLLLLVPLLYLLELLSYLLSHLHCVL